MPRKSSTLLDLHIPYKRWAYAETPNPKEEEDNYRSIELWAETLIKEVGDPDTQWSERQEQFVKIFISGATRPNIRHKRWAYDDPWNPAYEEANYRGLETFSETLATRIGSGKSALCILRVPHKRWAYAETPNPAFEEQNYRYIEQWASCFVRNCIKGPPIPA